MAASSLRQAALDAADVANQERMRVLNKHADMLFRGAAACASKLLGIEHAKQVRWLAPGSFGLTIIGEHPEGVRFVYSHRDVPVLRATLDCAHCEPTQIDVSGLASIGQLILKHQHEEVAVDG